MIGFMDGTQVLKVSDPNIFPHIRYLGYLYLIVAFIFIFLFLFELTRGGLSFLYIIYGIPATLIGLIYFFIGYRLLNNWSVSRFILTIVSILGPIFAVFVASAIPYPYTVIIFLALIIIGIVSLYIAYFSSGGYFKKSISYNQISQTVIIKKEKKPSTRKYMLLFLAVLLIPAILFLILLIRGLLQK